MYSQSHPRGKPIYAPGRDKPIGHVSGGAFRKVIRFSMHALRTPPAIAFDESTLRDAQAAGASWAAVTDADSGRVYRAPLERVWAKGFPVRRGFGDQWALALAHWSIDGATPELQAREEAQAAKDSQLALFGMEPAR